MDWLTATQQLRTDGLPGVLATVIDVRGHAPRELGAKMAVGVHDTWDSIGGGNLEASVIDRARAMIRDDISTPERHTFGLTEHARSQHGRQCCGGVVEVLLEPFLSRPAVAIFGLGHVGHDLARILSRMSIILYLVDSRAAQLEASRVTDITSGFADVRLVHSAVPDSVLSELPKGAHVFIMSHDHAEDFLLCDAALRHDDLGSIGLIGSRAKWSRFRQKLLSEGHSDSSIERITCPIGLPEIEGKAPSIIAVSAAASLLRILELGPR